MASPMMACADPGVGGGELRELKGFGSKALDEVKEKMSEMEL
jgi:hypothetical protein